jgi:hypothetical protein
MPIPPVIPIPDPRRILSMKILYGVAAVAAAAVLSVVGLGGPALAGPGASVIYSSLVASPLPGNLPSFGAEAYAFNEFGNEVTFAGTNRQLTNVVVTLSSWGCVAGHWYSGDCSTPAGATFSEPITLTIYNPPAADSARPGSVITAVTQNFAVPYRPSASPRCTDGRWWDASLKTCFNGAAVNVTFNLANVTAPDTVVYGIAYNTSHYGYDPITDSSSCPAGGCGYDSLNIAVSNEQTNVSAGTDRNPGTVWQYSSDASRYCDDGAAGFSIFRLDSPGDACRTPYIPAVQFKAGGGGHA